MLENEAKYNNETSTIHYVGIVQFVLKSHILYERSQILYEHKLCITESLLQKLQIFYDIRNRFLIK